MKRKTTKKDLSDSKYQISILQKHYEKMNFFQNKEKRINDINNKLSKLEKEYAKLQKQLNKDEVEKRKKFETNMSIEKTSGEMQKLRNLKIKVESDDDFNKYIIETCMIIDQYCKLEDLENNLLQQNTNDEHVSRQLHEIQIQKIDLTNEYNMITEDNYVSNKIILCKEYIQCDDCNQPRYEDGIYLTCPECGNCVISITQGENPSFKELADYEYRPQFTYDKRSHLEDWLRRFQSKENRVIPNDILDKVILEAKKERVRDLNDLSEDKVKKYLKKLGLNDYYDNVIGIINRINGRPPFQLTPEIENKIKIMFSQMQEPYEKYKPQNRKNFLSYSYTLHKIFQILGLHEFSKYFPLLKSADKLRQQDEIFKKIVDDLAEKDKTIKWVFYPSF
jgi:hypothetical protein